jgi:methyl-accepting chemotaxis protein
VPAIRKTTELVQEVAAASQEQASGVTQVNKAMGQMDQVTQRNASGAEELSSTAEELAQRAQGLRELINFFRVSDQGAAHVGLPPLAVRPPAPRPPARPAVHRPPRPEEGNGGGDSDEDRDFVRL